MGEFGVFFCLLLLLLVIVFSSLIIIIIVCLPLSSGTKLKAHQAMEVLWQQRHQQNNLVGSIINVQNGQWARKGERERWSTHTHRCY